MKRTSNINRRSSKRASREREAEPVRLALIERIGRCECCGKRFPLNMLACHEIANGAFRQRALDQEYALLVLCNGCHLGHVQSEPKARQMARLYLSDSPRYNLPAYWALICRREYPSQAEVDEQIEFLMTIGG